MAQSASAGLSAWPSSGSKASPWTGVKAALASSSTAGSSAEAATR